MPCIRPCSICSNTKSKRNEISAIMEHELIIQILHQKLLDIGCSYWLNDVHIGSKLFILARLFFSICFNTRSKGNEILKQT